VYLEIGALLKLLNHEHLGFSARSQIASFGDEPRKRSRISINVSLADAHLTPVYLKITQGTVVVDIVMVKCRYPGHDAYCSLQLGFCPNDFFNYLKVRPL
jgi:hypothetical protein